MSEFHPVHTFSDLISRIIRVLLVGIISGTAAALAALALVYLVAEGSHWIAESKAHTSTWLRILLTLSIPVLGGLIVGFVVQQMSDRRPHTPGDAILAVQSNLKLATLNLKDGFLNFIATIVGLGSGASLGVYGPIVNMGATLSASLQKYTRTEPSVLIGCGVAAAISAGFHAPIAGVIFAHEVIIRHFSLRAFAPITIAASISFYISKAVFHTNYLLQFEFSQILHLSEYAGFILIGILSGLLAVIFLRAILYAKWLSSKVSLAQQYKPMIAGMMMGLLALQIPDILGVGDQVMRQTLYSTPTSALDTSILILTKIIATALCLGFGFAGGIFSPSLLIGILFGSLFGLGVEQLFPYANIPMYAICGMAAVTSPVIGAPLTTILIIFELTHSYDLTTAVMVSVVFSNVVSYRLFGRSLFDFQLKSRGYDLSQGRDPLVLDTISVRSISHENFITATLGTSTGVVIEQLLEAHTNEAFVLDRNQHFVGHVNLADLLKHVKDKTESTPFDEIVNTHGLSLSPDSSLWTAMHDIKGFVGEAVPIVDKQSKRVVGALYEADLIEAYIQTLRELRNEETANA